MALQLRSNEEMSRWLAVLSLMSLMGCSLSYPRLTLATQMRIEADTHLDQVPSGKANLEDATVRVIADTGFCSGVVISGALVLTAQHCVTRSIVNSQSPAEIEPGQIRVELGGEALPWGRVGVRAVERCDGYDRVHSAFDVAVLVLDARLPLDMPQGRVRSDGPRGDEAVRAQGFGTGMHAYALPDFESQDAPHPIQAWSTTRVSRAGTIAWSNDDSFAADFSSAHGDSGGPIWGDDGSLLGVVSLRVETSSGADDRLTVGARVDACQDAIDRARSVEATIPYLPHG